jgi:hypothetical protein
LNRGWVEAKVEHGMHLTPHHDGSNGDRRRRERRREGSRYGNTCEGAAEGEEGDGW